MNLPALDSRYLSHDGRYLTIVACWATYRERLDGKAHISIQFATGARKVALDSFNGTVAQFHRKFKKVEV